MYKRTRWGFAFLAVLVGLCIWLLAKVPLKLGIDLRGGTLLTYSLDLSRIEYNQGAVADQVKDIIAKRLNAYGLKEISVQVQGQDHLIVRLPGSDPEAVEGIKKQVETAGNLNFRLVSTSEFLTPDAQKQVEEEERAYIESDRDWVARKAAVARQGVPFDERRPEPPKQVVRQYLEKDPGDPDAGFKSKGKYTLENAHTYNEETRTWDPEGSVSGSYLSRVVQTVDTETFRPAISFEFKGEGADQFGRLTEPNINRDLAIVLDEDIMQVARIRSRITNAGQLTGNFSDEEAKGIVTILRGGSLPTKPLLESESTVGSTLGQDALVASFYSMSAALAAVLIFMAVYYLIGGIIANLALLLNVFFTMAYVVCFRQDLSLPGVAGILLTIGMAVDANILIYERVREERKRGKSILHSVAAGYDRAFWVIFDSNITTLLTGFVLFKFGTGPVRGFAITLIAGIIASFFTSIYVSRLILSALYNAGLLKDLKMLQLFGTPRVPFVAKQKTLFATSIIVIVTTWCFVIARGKDNFGIDFNGGAQIGMNLKRPVGIDEMRAKVNALADKYPALFNDSSLQTTRAERPGFSRSYILLTRPEVEDGSGALVKTARAQEPPAPGAAEAPIGPELPPPAGGAPGAAPPGEAPAGAAGQPAPPAAQPAPPAAQPPAGQPAPPTEQPAPPAAPPAPPAGQPAPPAGQAPPAPVPPAAAPAPAPEEEKQERKTSPAQLVRAALEEMLAAEGLLLESAFPVVRWERDPAATLPGSEYLALEVNLLDVSPELTTDDLKADINRTLETEPLFRPADALEATGFQGIKVEKVDLGGKPAEATAPTTYAIRTSSYQPPLIGAVRDAKVPTKAQVEDALRRYFTSPHQKDGKLQFRLAEPFSQVDTVSGSVAATLQTDAVVAIFISMLGIIFYVSLRFEFIFGVGAVIALIHDVLIAIGVAAVTDQFFSDVFPVKINLTELAAILTIIGFSINDTIVIFDRIRENLQTLAKRKYTFEDIVDMSVNQTLARTIWTSLTTFLVTVVLLGFGGASVRGFAFVFTVGVISGVYSTVFIASPIVIWLHNRAVARRQALAEAAEV